MSGPNLNAFHQISRTLDFVAPLRALLDEFRRGNIADRRRVGEAAAIETHLRDLREAWDRVFPPSPACPWTRRTITWECFRGRRDAYLRQLIADCVPQQVDRPRLIVNPATVGGVHARLLARALPEYEVVGTDIDRRWNALYRLACFWKHVGLRNFRFVRESIYDADLTRRPAAVVFFGACGSVTDGCLDYALATDTPLLICRSCCHDNIGGNTRVAKRSRLCIHSFFWWKNVWFAQYKRGAGGSYFADRYGPSAYPHSRTARAFIDSDTMQALARHSPESDICRAAIDLDRCLYLQENGYDVMYREELFFAHRRGQ